MALGRPSTFSICAVDTESGEVGVAVQSKYFAVGSVVSWARAGVGAVATQAAGIAGYGPRLLDLLEAGTAPEEAIRGVLGDDVGRESRQLGVVAADGRSASWTGIECNAWAGHETVTGVAAQGNILAGEAVVAEMVRAFRAEAGTLAERLVAALEAGQEAGGDVRGQQSAAVYVERPGAGEETGELVDRVADLRVDDHEEPIRELRRLLEIHLRWDYLKRANGHRSAGRLEQGAASLQKGSSATPTTRRFCTTSPATSRSRVGSTTRSRTSGGRSSWTTRFALSLESTPISPRSASAATPSRAGTRGR